jgi:hypothetical protein
MKLDIKGFSMPEKNKGGRPRKDLEDIKFDGWQQLDALVVWSNEAYCAERLGISVDALAYKIKEKTGLSFSEYKQQKKEPLRINLLKKQYDVAMAGNVSMLIWLGKNELGQSDKQDVLAKSEVAIIIDKDDSNL